MSDLKPNVAERLADAAERGDAMRLMPDDVKALATYLRHLENANPLEWRKRALVAEAALAAKGEA